MGWPLNLVRFQINLWSTEKVILMQPLYLCGWFLSALHQVIRQAITAIVENPAFVLHYHKKFRLSHFDLRPLG